MQICHATCRGPFACPRYRHYARYPEVSALWFQQMACSGPHPRLDTGANIAKGPDCMSINRAAKPMIALALVTALSACGGGLFSNRGAAPSATDIHTEERIRATGSSDSIWDLFAGREAPDATISVNRYIW